ncbi:hypothetical protein [Streptomyces sp. RPT161]|uniref:hypothetical protein n=1 Tax=Streptomyces sp. RPT161 TaxID=3015993 RepID=UPI0022B8B43B|nr:hypothetical protein [Streptomyces sp. RPT161]
MTTSPSRPALKSIPTCDRPSTAEPTGGTPGHSALKNAARQGVRSALRPDPHPATPPRGDGRTPVAWLHVTAPSDRQAIPSATSWCQCGRYRTATGRTNVLRLVEAHTAHREHCPLRNPTERRNAA